MEPITLERIENDRRITRETDSEFLYEFQKSLLLALVESGRLTEQQYRYAEEKLRMQWYDFERKRGCSEQKAYYSAHLQNTPEYETITTAGGDIH